jgi:hypothetical protein
MNKEADSDVSVAEVDFKSFLAEARIHQGGQKLCNGNKDHIVSIVPIIPIADGICTNYHYVSIDVSKYYKTLRYAIFE